MTCFTFSGNTLAWWDVEALQRLEWGNCNNWLVLLPCFSPSGPKSVRNKHGTPTILGWGTTASRKCIPRASQGAASFPPIKARSVGAVIFGFRILFGWMRTPLSSFLFFLQYSFLKAMLFACHFGSHSHWSKIMTFFRNKRYHFPAQYFSRTICWIRF